MAKPIQWLGDSIDRVREFSETGRYHTGRELRRVQSGEMPTVWKPMITVCPGVAEIRIHAENE
jgi:phage-related protein